MIRLFNFKKLWDKELITVIVPVYNVEEYLPQCLNSIVNQTYSNLEIILIDDGSTDNSGAICDIFAAKYNNITVIHQQNKGLSAARNAGMDICHGKWFVFIDSDDYVEPNYVSLLYKTAIFLNVDLAECDRSGTRINYKNPPIQYTKHSVQYFISHLEKFIEHYPYAWNKIYKSSTFLKYRFAEGKIHEDILFINQYLKDIKQVGYVNQYLYHYRYREGSITKQPFSVKNLTVLEAYVERYFICKEIYPAYCINMLRTIGSYFIYRYHKYQNDKSITSRLIEIIQPVKEELYNLPMQGNRIKAILER